MPRHPRPPRVSRSSVRVGEQAGIAPHRLAIGPPMRMTAPSAAAARRDTACPWRSSAPRPAPRAASAGAAAARHSGAWSGRGHRCSTPAPPGRRRRRRSARRPSSAAHRLRPAPRSTAAPVRQDVLPLRASVYGLVTRGVSATRVTDMSTSKVDLALARPARRSARPNCGVGAGGERDMPLAGHQAGGGVQADPAGARQIDLGPGMQVGEIGGRPLGPASSGFTSATSWIR